MSVTYRTSLKTTRMNAVVTDVGATGWPYQRPTVGQRLRTWVQGRLSKGPTVVG